MNHITFKLGEIYTFKARDEYNISEVSVKLISISDEQFTFKIKKQGKKSIIIIHREDTILMLGNHYVVSGYGTDFVRFSLKYIEEDRLFKVVEKEVKRSIYN